MADLEAKIDVLCKQVAELTERQRRTDELFEELVPIMKLAMATGTEKLGALEQKGYFAFGKSLLEVADNIVTGYTPDDVRELAGSVVTILDTLRSLTQPHALQVMREAGQVVEHSDSMEPLGVVGMLKASREENVQRGMAVMLEVLRHVGKGAEKADRRERLRRQLASKARPAPAMRRLPPPKASSAAPPAAAPAAPAKAPQTSLPGLPNVALTAEGFLADSAQWNRDVATAIAQSIGVTMTDRHWELIESARKDFEQTGASPNIRRITKVSGIDTKEIYGMFPKAPGKCCAMIAGLPKPVGCI